MNRTRRIALAILALGPILALAQTAAPQADWDMVARIREEGLQRSQVMDIVGYMTDVIGPRLTLSQSMKRAHAWARETFVKLGLENVTLGPFMGYGVPWDNEYTSVHMIEPAYHRGQAAADHPGGLVGRRGAGPLRIRRIRQKTLRRSARSQDRQEARL